MFRGFGRGLGFARAELAAPGVHVDRLEAHGAGLGGRRRLLADEDLRDQKDDRGDDEEINHHPQEIAELEMEPPHVELEAFTPVPSA